MNSLATIVLRPAYSVGRALDTREVAKVLLLFLVIDFVLSLMLTPAYIAMVAAQKGVDPSTRPVVVGFAVVVGSITNVAVTALVAGLMSMGLAVAGGRPAYGKVIGALLVASVPLLVDRVIRVGLHVAGRLSRVSDEPFSLSYWTAVPSGAWSWFFRASVFDVAALVLVYVGVRAVGQVSRIAAFTLTVAIWGGSQLFLMRIAEVAQ